MPIPPTYQELVQRIRELESAAIERSDLEKSLQESEEKFRLLYENAPVAYQSLDIRGRILEVNQAWLNTLGYEREEVIGQRFSSFLHPDWTSHFEQNFPRFKAVGEVMGVEFEMVKKDGEVILVSFDGKIGTHKGGGFLRTHCILSNITQSKKIEDALLRSELKFRSMAESSNDVFWMSTCGIGKMLYASPVYESLWERSRIDLYKNPCSFLDAIHPDDIEGYRETVNAFHKAGTKYTCIYRIIQKSGRIKWIRERGYPVPQKIDGDDVMTGVCTDITRSMQAEATLHAERKKLKVYFENLPLLAYNISLDGRIADCNDVAVQILGYDSKGDLIGQPLVSKVYAPNSRKKAGKLLEAWQAGQRVQNEELQVMTRQGEAIDVLLNVTTILNARKEPLHSISTHLVISDRKRAERALEKSERKYRSMMEAIVDPLFICSQDLKVEYANPAMTKRLGREMVGEKCHVALHGLDHQCDRCVYGRVQDGETVKYNVTSPLDNRTYRVNSMPVYNEDGSCSKLTILRDITDYLQVVAEKERAQAHLLQAQKMEAIGTLAGGVAHDFNNILASIIGFAELALEDAEKSTLLEENLEQVIAAGQRAKNLVKQILAFARQSSDDLQPIRVGLIAKEVLMFIRSSLPTSIAIKPDISSHSSILGDPTQVHQIFMNLCANAAHAMAQDGGVLDVGVKDISIDGSASMAGLHLKPGNYIRITVLDTGGGIAPKDLDSIFEPYYTTKGVGEGTGMGLAVVHGIVESYGGKITVSSRLGKGTSFAVYLPAMRITKMVDAQSAKTVPTGTEKILFIDDEASITKYGYQALKKIGYQVTTRTSSVEALSLFRKKPDNFDLVITDMTMPNMTGYELAREILRIKPGTPIIICTGYSGKLTEEDALSIGIKAMAYKPLATSDLATIIRKVMDGKIDTATA